MKSITILLLKYFNSTYAFLLPVKLNESEISRVYTVIKHIAHFLFFHYCYPAGASAEERVYGMIDPISLRLRSGSYRGSYWNKPLPRIQKHFPESKTHPRIQKYGQNREPAPARIQNTSQNPKTLPTLRNTSQNLRILGRVFGFRDVFWILRSVLPSRAIVGNRRKRLQTRPRTPSSRSSPEARQLRCIINPTVTRPHINIKHLPTHHNSIIVYENEVTRLQDVRFQ